MATSKPTTQISRADLYDLVWRKPRTALAKDLHVSDVAIAKACRKHGIPMPPVGYWTKVAHGKPVERPPLPACDDPNLKSVEFEPWRRRAMGTRIPANLVRDDELLPDFRAMVEHERVPEHAVIVPTALPKRLHPLVEATRVALKAKPDERGIVVARGKNALNVAVSRESIGRALRILNALVLAFEARGMAVRTVRDDRRSTPDYATYGSKVTIQNEQIGIRLVEKVRRVERTPTASEKRMHNTMSALFGRSRQYYDSVATGQLALETDSYNGSPRIRDGKKSKIEDRLNEYIVALVCDANETRKTQLLWEERRRHERERAEAEAARRAAEEIRQQELVGLLADVEAWQQANGIRAYVAAARAVHGTEPTPEAVDVFAWAEAHADRLDPLITTPSDE